MDMEHDVAENITDGGVGVQGSVLKEAKGTNICVLGCLGLVGRHQAKVYEHGGVNCNGIL